MSKSLEQRTEATKKSQDKPAIGIIANGRNDNEIARICLRARTNDYEVFITHDPGVNLGISELYKSSDARIVPPEGDRNKEQPKSKDAARQRLAAAARGTSSSGLIVVENTSIKIDFDKSLEAFESDDDAFVSDAVSERAIGVESVVAIPAYNEENTIGAVVEDVSTYVDDVVVIDDGSSDETASRAQSAGATVISHDQNRGYGAALKTAFETAANWNVECLVIIDGDGQHDSNDVPKLCSKVVDEDTNVAIGSRFTSEGKESIPLYRRFGLAVVNVMSNVSMGAIHPRSWISDTQSGFRAYDRHAIEELADANLGDDMDASLDILYEVHGNGYEIEEVSTVVDYDVENGHSQNPIAHGIQLIMTILRTVEHEHPIKFVGLPGFIMTVIGVGFAYATMANFISSGTFPLGFALVSVFFTLIGVFACFTAIILHSLNQLHE